MRTLFRVILSLFLISSSLAYAESKPKDRQKMTVSQLDQLLAAGHDKDDSVLAQELSSFELTERLSGVHLTQLGTALPGEKSRDALLILADQSAFLDPPASEIDADSIPDPAATRAMLVKIVNYVNTTLRQLPNLIAARDTVSFEDRPQQDSLEATGIVSYSDQPLHAVGHATDRVTFRDRKEQVEEGAGKQKQGKIGGMITTGEFGPILSTVVGDALKGKISWARWEHSTTGRLAVFRYAVPEDKSNYRVRFCCILDGFNQDGQPNPAVFDERSAYHGEITFNPSDGAIMRITMQADRPATGLVPIAGISIDYSPVDIAGKTYVCPVRSVSVLAAHIEQPHGMYSQASFTGNPKKFLNDTTFSQYRRFGSESRILTGENQPQ